MKLIITRRIRWDHEKDVFKAYVYVYGEVKYMDLKQEYSINGIRIWKHGFTDYDREERKEYRSYRSEFEITDVEKLDAIEDEIVNLIVEELKRKHKMEQKAIQFSKDREIEIVF